MRKTIKKVVETGYGLGLLSLTEAKKIALKVKTELNLSDEESLKLARELMRNSEQASRDVLATADRYFEAALVKSGVTSKGEIKRVKNILKKRAQKVKATMKENVKERWRNLRKKG